MKINVAVFASGRGTNFQAILQRSMESDAKYKIRMLVSDRKEATALQIAANAGIENHFVDPKTFSGKKEYEEHLVELVRQSGCDLVCLAGYMRILGKTFLQGWQKDVMNIHPSLLPSFKGLEAQQQALEYGVKYTGCTVHFVDEGMDTGAVIDQRVVPVFHTDDESSLSERIIIEEHQLYPELVQLYARGKIRKNGRWVIIRE